MNEKKRSPLLCPPPSSGGACLGHYPTSSAGGRCCSGSALTCAEVSDGGERTKEDRIGDSLVTWERKKKGKGSEVGGGRGEGDSSLTAPPAAGATKLQ